MSNSFVAMALEFRYNGTGVSLQWHWSFVVMKLMI